MICNSLSYGYTGRWQRDSDASTELIRMGVREYDPALGRFISVDPLKGDSANPQSRNPYVYALNDPMTVYDLDGRQAYEATAGGAVVIVITIPVTGPVVIGGSIAGGAALGGGLLSIELSEQRNKVQPSMYEDNKCIVPAPWNHPDAHTFDYWNPFRSAARAYGSTGESLYCDACHDSINYAKEKSLLGKHPIFGKSRTNVDKGTWTRGRT